MMFQSGRRLKQLMRGARQSGWTNARRQRRLKIIVRGRTFGDDRMTASGEETKR